MGVFARDDIKKGETLMVIPQAYLVTSGGSKDMCDTACNLVKERKLGKDSKYLPYIDYVLNP